jgi:excisionase family DNA binding protein
MSHSTESVRKRAGIASHRARGSLALPLIGAKDAAHLLGIGVRLLWSLTNEGKIPHVRVRTRVLYRPEQLEEYIQKQTRGGKP